MTPPEQTRRAFDPAEMARLLDGEQGAVRGRVRAVLARPSFRYLPVTASIEEQREQAFRWCQELAEAGVGLLAVPTRYGGAGDFAGFMAAFETIAFHDLGMTIKFTVQFGIWLGSVLLLGNERQHGELLKKIGTFELPGCFAMTEIGHGSNVRELETTAVYDAGTEEFVVTSPTWTAGKNYIGNGVCHGRLATVFAQLETRGERHGVHALLVPLRGEDGAVLPGVRIEDNGPKMGENGVDNARIWFDGVRVGRGALLDRFGRVAADGSYRSEIGSAGARFFATISALVGGRISIALAGLSAAKSGLAIAVRYAARRRQFRAPGAAEDTALLDYPTHQRRLMPLLANAYALDFMLKDLVRRRAETLGKVGSGKAEDGSGEAEVVRRKAEAPRTEDAKFTKEGESEVADGTSREGPEMQGARGPKEKGKEPGEERGVAEGKRELELLAAGVKAWGTWNTTRTLQTCRECCGGEGYMSVNRLPALKADSDIFTTFEGDNTVLMLWVGRQLLARHIHEQREGIFRTAKYDAEAIFAYQIKGDEMFVRRAEETIREVHKAVQERIGRGIPEHQAISLVQNALLRAAQAYIELVVYQQFKATVEAQPEGGLKTMLSELCQLFTASLFEQHRGWYLEHQLMEPGFCRSMPGLVDAGCGALAPYAEALVEAFGIPAQCLGAPIAGV